MFPVDTFQKTIARIVAIPTKHEIRFHLTGGLTGAAYGEPRLTQGIDLVLDPDQTCRVLDNFIESLAESDFLFDESSLRQAVQERGMFQLLDQREVLKLDLYPRELIEGELSRSEPLELFEGTLRPVACRADVAASKLVWISKGSHKSRQDLRAIYRNANESQQADIARLAEALGLASLLKEVLGEPDEIT